MQDRTHEPNGKPIVPDTERRMNEPATRPLPLPITPRGAPFERPVAGVTDIRPGWWRRMTRSLGRLNEAAATRTAPWMPGLIVALTVMALTQAGTLLYWIGHTNAVIRQHEKDFARMEKDYESLEEYVQVFWLYESKVRELIVTTGAVNPRDLPPLPIKPRTKRGD